MFSRSLSRSSPEPCEEPGLKLAPPVLPLPKFAGTVGEGSLPGCALEEVLPLVLPVVLRGVGVLLLLELAAGLPGTRST